MHCEQIQPNLLDYGRGLLSGPEASRIAKHLGKCAQCKAVLEEELAFAKRLEAVPAQGPANDVWALVRTRTKPRRISLRALSGLFTGPAIMRKAFAFTAAAGLVAGLVYTGIKPEAPTPTVKRPTNTAVVVKWSDDPMGKHADALVKFIDEM